MTLHLEDRLRRLVTQRLESLRAAGVAQLPRREPASAPVPSPGAATAARVAAPLAEPPATVPSRQEAPVDMSKQRPAGKAAALAVIQREVRQCVKCPELASARKQTVFGVGDPQARLCFFGEAPGADEDAQGEPFVGRAGRLLTDIIEKGMGLTRADVYILNVLKCRPPGNRNPSVDETANCRGFFERQFAAIQPEFICCLGTVAAQALLETTTPVGRLRGEIHHYGDAKVVVTYHPSYLLRNPSAKKHTWDDIQLLMREMGMRVPARS